MPKISNRGELLPESAIRKLVPYSEKAKELGWDSHTGHGMNARNDYILLTGITDNLGVIPPAFAQFEILVAEAS